MEPAILDRFLRGRRVAVLAVPRGERPPLATPIWYDYDGARFRIQVEATSAKAKLVGRHPTTPVSLVVQSEVPPYRYAIIYGTARLGVTGDARLRRSVARRYVGRLAGDTYVKQEDAAGRHAADLRMIEITPERIVTHDFGPDAGWFGRLYFGIYRWLRPVPA
ncbi:MAG: hypothetical protein HY271_13925 [Deltaproteobacteria bacterium]|nr:hypothetical protein [Deltaproteobacteria bacterium]